MKNLILIFSSLLFVLSCTQNESSINISAQIEVMKQDPISLEYFEAISASAKSMSERQFDLDSYKAIMELQDQNVCNIDMKVFKRDSDMENYAKTQCRLTTAVYAFNKKYPFIRKMSRVEKEELFTPLMKTTNYDMDKIKSKIEKS